MACRERGKVNAPGREEYVGADEERARFVLDEGSEGCINVRIGTGCENLQL